MSYAFERTGPVGREVRRIALHQLDGALVNLADPDDGGVGEAVHDTRKRTKKVRGLLRLVQRPLGDEHRPANRALRDAALTLSPLRDARALLDTFQAMRPAAAGLDLDTDLALVHAGLAARAERAEGLASDRTARIDEAARLLGTARDRIETWELTGGRWRRDDGWASIERGLADSYRRGRRARRAAIAQPGPATFHEWRKAAKHTWYHVRLLAPMAPSVLDPLADRFSDLADALGDDHDLAVLVEHLDGAPEAFGGPAVTARVAGVIGDVRSELERRAVSTGGRLYAEGPDRFVHRMHAYWRIWHRDGDEVAAAGVADVASALGERPDEPAPA